MLVGLSLYFWKQAVCFVVGLLRILWGLLFMLATVGTSYGRFREPERIRIILGLAFDKKPEWNDPMKPNGMHQGVDEKVYEWDSKCAGWKCYTIWI